MPEQDLRDPDVDTAFEQPGRVAMPQRMWRDASGNPGSSGRLLERQPQCVATDRPILAGARAQPALVAMGLPEAAQLGENRLRQRYLPLFVALADNAEQSIDAVDRRDFERRSLAD